MRSVMDFFELVRALGGVDEAVAALQQDHNLPAPRKRRKGENPRF